MAPVRSTSKSDFSWTEQLKYSLYNLHCKLQHLLQMHQYKKRNKTPTLLELTRRWTNLLLFS